MLSYFLSLSSSVYNPFHLLPSTSSRQQAFIPTICGDEHRGIQILETFFDVGLESYYAEHVQSRQCWISKIQYYRASKEPSLNHDFVLLHVNRGHEKRPFGHIFVDGDHKDAPLSSVASLFNLRFDRDKCRPARPPPAVLSERSGRIFPVGLALFSSSSHDHPIQPLSPRDTQSKEVARVVTPRAVLLSDADVAQVERCSYHSLAEVVCTEGEVLLTHFIAAGRVISQSLLRSQDPGFQSRYFLLAFGHLLSEGKLLDRVRELDAEIAALRTAADDFARKRQPEYAEQVKRIAALKPASERRKELEDERARAQAETKRAHRAEARLAESEKRMAELETRVKALQLQVSVPQQLDCPPGSS